ncbi:hypothetical protein B0A48_06826 [Cryoendolithus antarcticus]|uniref:Piwi domain-containing protein n=1 Tax=Cryoendolithus antarcticus TaxID=1507870 RepID=A0A1V8T9E9_9PEZI|nr:hypothetical protein B0A48_06826 [Cryoendolithus antarcticus]
MPQQTTLYLSSQQQHSAHILRTPQHTSTSYPPTATSMAGPQKKRAEAERAPQPSTTSGSTPHPPSVNNRPLQRVTAMGGFDGSRDGSPSNSPSTRPIGSPRPATTSPSQSAVGSPSVSGSGRTKNYFQLTQSLPKNLDLGMQQWNTVRGYAPSDVVQKPSKPSTLGQATKIGLNTFNVVEYPKVAVYQYEVLVGNGVEKRGLVRAVWECATVQNTLGKGFIFDGNRLAWSLKNVDRELRLNLNMDQERSQTTKAGKQPDTQRILIRQTNKVHFDTLLAYMSRKVDHFDNGSLEAINFLDHLLREYPSKQFTQIKRSFFKRGENRTLLGRGVEAMKGVYQSLRMAHTPQGATLTINVDVANGMFFTASRLDILAFNMVGCRNTNDLIQVCRTNRERAHKGLKLLKRVKVITKHRGSEEAEWCIESFIFKTAKEHKFQALDKQSVKEVTTSIFDYFAKSYNIRLQFPELPLVKMTRGKNTIFPMELCIVKENQRYPFKCDEKQTSEMIKFAVTPPAQRWAAIDHGLKMLDWSNDPVLKHFGLRVNPTKTVVDGRVLTAPVVKYGAGDAKPGTSGRWDLKGKKFLASNPAPLKAWSITVCSGRRGGKPEKATIDNFVAEFVKIYKGHGGKVENASPVMNLTAGDDVGDWVTKAWNAAGTAANARPQILLFILPDKDAGVYGRIKRSAECRYGVVTQCMQYAHVQKCQPQYISNVLMKFNAKLGGTTCRAVGPKSGGPGGIFTVPTMIIGADVSHAAPGSQAGSMAALTVSMDNLAARYSGSVQTNGYRVEMITTENINSLLKPQIQHWVQTVGNGKFPQRVIYMRDGVSEGQYRHVLEQEIHDIKALLKSANAAMNIPITAIVGSKRHHIRFFPDRGDRNGNPLPGTFVETGVTHPFENDFYLCAHAAIKGTARPTHYHVILNECKMSNDEIYTLLYEHSYQYMRATTPVSIHPAIYYAHIAALRAVSHDPKWGNPSEGAPQQTTIGSSDKTTVIVDPLLPMPNQGAINTSMWYI